MVLLTTALRALVKETKSSASRLETTIFKLLKSWIYRFSPLSNTMLLLLFS